MALSLPALCLTLLGQVLTGVRPARAAPPRAAPDPDLMAQLWVEPTDLESRDLFWGPGGRKLIPRSDVDYRFRELDDQGHSLGYEVSDPEGHRWKVKVGEEAQSEIAVSRILWAIGYHQPVLHYLARWRLSGGPAATPPPGRFRLESDHDKEGEWSWRENPFVGTRPFHGLLVANVLLNNWDLDTDNNRIYRPESPRAAPATWYVVQDVGGSLGKSSFPLGSRNEIEDFESQKLIAGVDGGRVRLDHPTIHAGLLKEISPDDVLWTCRLLARLSERQLTDAFRAAGYPAEIGARYVRKIRAKVQEGLALRASAGGAE